MPMLETGPRVSTQLKGRERATPSTPPDYPRVLDRVAMSWKGLRDMEYSFISRANIREVT